MSRSKTAAARRSRILMTSFGATTAAAITVVVVTMLSGATAAQANTCTLSSTAGTLNWSSPASWPGCTSPGGYPSGGDTAVVNSGPSNTLVVDVPVDVLFQLNASSTGVTVQNGLTLESSSTAVSGSSITINSGGTLAVAAGGSVGGNINSNILLNSGGLFSIPSSSTYTFGVSSSFTFTGGTIQGPGTLTNPSGHTITFDGTTGPMVMDGALLFNNSGTVNYSPTNIANGLSIDNGSQFNNQTFSILNLQSSVPIGNTGTPSAINNDGNIYASPGGASPNNPVLNVPVNNNTAGYIALQDSVNNQTITLAGGGTQNGSFDNITPPIGTFQLNGPHVFTTNSDWTFGPSSVLEILGGSTTFNINFTMPTIIQDGGTLSSPPGVTITSDSLFDWKGGTQDGGGTTNTYGGNFFIDGTAPATLDNRIVVLDSLTNFVYNPGAGGSLGLINSSQINITNGSTVDLQSDTTITSDGTGLISNVGGTLKKSTGVKTIVQPEVIVSGTGAAIQTGANTTIDLAGGGFSGSTNGLIDTSAANSFVEFGGGSFVMYPGTTVTSGNFILSAGSLSIDTPLSIATYKQTSGSLTTATSNSLTIGNSALISGGSITGGLQVNVNAGSSFTFNTIAPVGLDGAVINLGSGATASWSGSSPISMSNDAKIGVTCPFTWTATAPIAYVTGTMPLISVNAGGTIYKTGSSSPIGVAVLLQNNGGLIKSDNGALQLNTTASSIHTGAFNPISPGSIDFATGAHTFNAITETGSGFMNFLSGTMTFNNPTSLVNLYMGTVTLAGTGPLTFTGIFNWDGGALNVPATNSGGTLNLLGTASQMDLGANLSSGANFSSASSAFALGSGVTFTNTGTFTITGDAPINGLGTFINNPSSTLTKTAGTGTTIFTSFNNDGSVNAVTGALNFKGSGTDTGTYSSSAGASLNFGSSTRTLTSAASVGTSVNGTTTLGPGLTFSDSGIFTPTGPVTINGGAVTLNTVGAATINALTMSSGSLSGSSPLQLSGTSNWSGGTISGSGSFTLAAGGVVNVNSGTGALLDTRNLTNFGTININSAGTTLTINNNGTITNQASGIIALTNDGSIISTTGLGTSFINSAGIFRKTCCASGTSLVDASFSNLTGGTLDLQSGTVSFTGFMGQGGGTTKLNGGTFAATNPANYTGGLLTGSGSFNASLLNNGATINPDSFIAGVPGTITIGGSWTQTAGNVTIDLFGNGSNDLVTVPTSSASVGGTMTVQLVSPYVPTSGDTFNVLHASSLSDTTTKTYPPYGPSNTGSFNATATASDLTLTAFLNQADLSITKTGPATVAAGSNAVYTITVTNAGPVAASSVTVSDPAVAGLTFVSASGACTAFPCNIASIAASSSAAITATYSTSPAANTTATNTASVSSTTNDPVLTNNSASITTTIAPSTDIAVSVTGPATAVPNSNVTLTIKITNLGPSNATGVAVASSIPAGMTFVSNSGACTTAYPCTIGALNAGQFVTITSVYTVGSNGGVTLTPSFTASSTTTDPNSANNTGTHAITAGCPTAAPTSLSPANTQTNVPVSGVLSWNDVNAAKYNIYLGPMGSGCNAPYGTVVMGSARITQLNYSGLDEGATYEWAVEAVTPGCTTIKSSCVRFQTLTNCTATAPTPLSPSGSITSSPVTFTWTASAGATLYTVKNAADDSTIGTSTTTSLSNITIDNGPLTWYVVADVPGCGALRSTNATFNACTPPLAPLAGAVAEAATGQTFAVQWDRLNHVTSYSLEEARSEAFDNPTITVVAQPTSDVVSVSFTKQTTSGAATFFYRVRAKSECNDSFGPYSIPIRVVVLPPPPPTQHNPNVTVPVGSKLVVVQQVFIPGINDGVVHTFTATVDKPWLTVVPSTGILPADGITLDVKADPSTLPNGTATGTVIVSISSGTGKSGSNGSSTVTVPVSVNLVTPVVPSTKDLPPDNALIIPAVGHLDGLNSHWQSDIRLANTGSQKLQYALKFTPADASSGVKTTTIDVEGGATTALDDIVRNWYGIGTLGESANGSLEIRPLAPQGKTGSEDTPSVSKVTVVSSRTYNTSDNGTLGQFIPAIPFSSFIGKAAQNAAASVLSLQQISQSQQYRTNLGIVEGAGAAANVLLSVFDVNGNKLKEVPLALKAGQQVQVSNFLASVGIPTLSDGRVEVKVTSGDGRVTAYASVVDNQTSDPLLVSGVKLGGASANRYVLPGVADINTGAANWRTDVRVFNGGTSAQNATLTFFRSGSAPLTQTLVINAGEIRTLDSIVASTFGVTGTGGAVHVSTPTNSNLIVSGRTYNATSNGTYGQYIPAVTAADSIGNSDRPLQILQVEDSVRYRTNVGLAEVTGKPASVEVSVNLPDSKVTPLFHIDLGANDFQQFNVFRALGLENVYNARISVRVTDGDGKVTAYGSVVDMLTNDPTYVPAQQ